MTVSLELCPLEDAHVIQNLFPLYLYDLSEVGAATVNLHGVLHDDDELTTLAAQAELTLAWWRRPGVLFPYLLRVDGRPAGFDLIAAREALPDALDADFVVHEYFVLRALRGTGVAEAAALAGFERHRGLWEVVTYPQHARAIAFWRRVLQRYRPGEVEETERDHVWGRRVCFRFETR